MATYAIGDIQGCADELETLLSALNFRPGPDKLWLVGDLVNRGPKSLKTLQLIYDMREHVQIVLGNHDLHLLAVTHGHAKLKKRDTLAEILASPDRKQLLPWLQRQPLIYQDDTHGLAMVHAGLVPEWDVATAIKLGGEVSDVLRGTHADDFFAHMYGNKPKRWKASLSGIERLRFITNVLTRIRYCNAKGKLDLEEKGNGAKTRGYKPWFKLRQNRDEKIIFGHWSTLNKIDYGNIHCLDTGCVWGGTLTALCIETGIRTQVPSNNGIPIIG